MAFVRFIRLWTDLTQPGCTKLVIVQLLIPAAGSYFAGR